MANEKRKLKSAASPRILDFRSRTSLSSYLKRTLVRFGVLGGVFARPFIGFLLTSMRETLHQFR